MFTSMPTLCSLKVPFTHAPDLMLPDKNCTSKPIPDTQTGMACEIQLEVPL